MMLTYPKCTSPPDKLQIWPEIRYSVESDNLWLELWEFLGIISSVPPQETKILEKGVLHEVPLCFPGARLNYAENLLNRTDDAIAITGESGVITNCTFWGLREMVRVMAAALKVHGLKVGDRVAAIISNSLHCVIIALVTASIGGIFSSTATDMGTSGILERYRQITLKFVFAEIEVLYGGKPVALLPKVTEVIKNLFYKGLQQAIWLSSRMMGYEINLENATSITESADNRKLEFEQLPFSRPLFILYSSGMSGKSKSIVHSAGLGASPEDTYFQYTTTRPKAAATIALDRTPP
ncbi:uncharacterized protein LACBIDRAFT_299469 [Laccaria bicolor S238N-H82]|uniref:Predicted protein n=1 Tax=Laccaria bicolor (strain S238N-H82 / ATCC MYA-4686) TaxID=486041 RepID=B0DES3_LACBS|nr:uncharacterized protein LACBIDRAFT_299469 [Laccaria bicolor S238N-H82]EDR07077.1 predicted protein [Laccaria bicolor S238N-H82]|eukprot:XP_001882450.1 predicted protein [Laccaria bicolor S238N-H82]